MEGGGKYDAECTAAREATGGRAVMLIVLHGKKGNGHEFQMRGDAGDVAAALEFMSSYLRLIADAVDEDRQRIQQQLKGTP